MREVPQQALREGHGRGGRFDYLTCAENGLDFLMCADFARQRDTEALSLSYMYIYICIYVCVCIYVCIYIYIYMYTCMYIFYRSV
jgi:hypothetical protein